MTIQILILFTFLACISLNNSCCIFMQEKVCASCPRQMHLYRGNCIFDIPNCITYRDGLECAECGKGYIADSEGYECTIQSEQGEDTVQKLDLDSGQTEIGQLYRAIQTVIKGYFKELGQSKTISGQLEKSSKLLSIQYEKEKEEYYELKLKVITNKQLQIVQLTKIQSLTYPEDIYLQDAWNLFDSKNSQTMIQLNTIANQNNPAISSLLSINQRTYSSKTQYRLSYSGADANYLIVINSINSSYHLYSIMKQDTKHPQITLQIQLIPSISINDQYYNIVREFVEQQQTQYQGIQPINTTLILSSKERLYILTYVRNDNSTWLVQVRVDVKEIRLFYQKQTQIGEGQASSKYKRIEIKDIFKDFYFIIVRDQISKQLNKRYEKYTIYRVGSYTQNSIVYYNTIFKSAQNKFEYVQANIHQETFTVEVSQYTQIQQAQAQQLYNIQEQVGALTFQVMDEQQLQYMSVFQYKSTYPHILQYLKRQVKEIEDSSLTMIQYTVFNINYKMTLLFVKGTQVIGISLSYDSVSHIIEVVRVNEIT